MVSFTINFESNEKGGSTKEWNEMQRRNKIQIRNECQ